MTQTKQKRFEYDAAFQAKMSRTLVQMPDFALTMQDYLDPDVFDRKVHRWVVRTTLEHCKRYGAGIDKHALLNAFSRAVKAKKFRKDEVQTARAFVETIDKPVKNRDYVKDEIFNFVRNQDIEARILELLTCLEEQKFDEASKIFADGQRTQSLGFASMGHFYVRDRDQRLERRRTPLAKGIPTGIPNLDSFLKHKGVPKRKLAAVIAPPGRGKCLGKGTLVLRYDGRRVRVEDVREGDLLMGPDSTPRKVLSTTRGRSPLFKIKPTKGRPWVCNDVHVLTLRHGSTREIVDIPLDEYLEKGADFKHRFKQFSVGVDFPKQEPLPIDPYFLGVWFGDGHKALTGVRVSKPDPEIRKVMCSVALQFGYHVHTSVDARTGCPTHSIVGTDTCGVGRSNKLLDLMRSIVGPNITIPKQYLTASREDRCEFLAGLLDTDGHLHYGGYDIVQKRKDYAVAIAFLARSLGLRAGIRRKYVNGEPYFRVKICGDCSFLPMRIPRKKAPPRNQIKDVTQTGFSVVPLGEGDYFGFTLDGDGRFLLGDFTVTHNTATLVHLGRSAVVYAGAKVLHISINEMSEEDMQDRYDAAFTQVSLGELESKSERKKIWSRAGSLGKQFGEFLVIKEFDSATVGSIEAYIKMLATVGFYPDVVMIDYADLITPARFYDSSYEEAGLIYRDLRAMAKRLNVVVWTASQTKREATNKPNITKADLAESFKKAHVADLLIALCQSTKERRTKRARWYIDKSRLGPSEFELPVCRVNWAKQVILPT